MATQTEPHSPAMGAPEAFTATTEVGHFIDGRAVPSRSGRRQAVFNPSTGAVARQVALASVDEVNAAVAAARAAFPAWADTPPIRRARVLNAFLQLLMQHRDTLGFPKSREQLPATHRVRICRHERFTRFHQQTQWPGTGVPLRAPQQKEKKKERSPSPKAVAKLESTDQKLESNEYFTEAEIITDTEIETEIQPAQERTDESSSDIEAVVRLAEEGVKIDKTITNTKKRLDL